MMYQKVEGGEMVRRDLKKGKKLISVGLKEPHSI
jgi:hypothetical protein